MNFIHVPKTGGSSFKAHLRNSNISFEAGHHVEYGEGDYITFIREPISRTLAHFNANSEKRPKDFKEWLSLQKPNFQTNFLMEKILKTKVKKGLATEQDLNKIIKILDKFYFVGLTENMDSNLKKLSKELGFKLINKKFNVSKKRHKPTNEEKWLILDKNELDLKLYNHFKTKDLNKSIN